MCPDNVLKKHKRKSQPLDLDRRQQICPFCMAELVVAMATTAAHIRRLRARLTMGGSHAK